jgi:tRNA(Ile)-lysidine synthase
VNEIAQFAAAHALSGPGLAAVSGGADSVALLRGLLDAGVPHVAAAHFNHQLRGAESDADEAFVRDLAAQLGVPFHRGAADVAALAASQRENLEGTARHLRYKWLAELAKETGAAWVATGHTADDQAETVLHRLIRGTGIPGLRGIAARRELTAGVQLLRPMLNVTRADVLDYLRELDQPFRDDATNADTAFTRNRIRHELLPLLKTFNPQIVTGLCRLTEQAEETTDVLEGEAARLLRRVELARAGPLVILDLSLAVPTSNPIAHAEWVHPHLVREMFRQLWGREGWPTGGMTFAHWDRLVAIALGVMTAADFPSGVFARRVGRVVQLGRRT